MEKHTIKEWMKIRGVSRERIADRCGVTGQTITNWQQRPGGIQIRHALKLAQSLEVDINDILFVREN